MKQTTDYPAMLAPVNHVEPTPRRVRGYLGGEAVFDTTRALYVWEWPNYPQYFLPLVDVAEGALVDEQHTRHTKQGVAQMHGLNTGGQTRGGAARVFTHPSVDRLVDTVRFEWAALDQWFEEDEQVFVHPRNPYTRVDALRSTRKVRVELDGVLLAESAAPVMVFETAFRPATTSTVPRYISITSKPPTRSPSAPTRELPAATGPFTPPTLSTAIWRGRMTSPLGN